MNPKKLDKWADLLLDTGKRNSLINFKDTKASTAEILFPSTEILFKKIEGSSSFEVFDTRTIEKRKMSDEADAIKNPRSGASSEPNSESGKSAFLEQYSKKIKRQNQILLYNAATNPIAAVKNIDKKARQFIDETGVNVAYMSFGFIHWKESDSSNCDFRAPVLLVPIRLEQNSSADTYFIKSDEDDIIVNPTFSYKLQAEYNIELPKYMDEDLPEYLAKVKRRVAKLQWTVTAECRIGIFSFLKINMYRDLKDNTKAILSNRNILKLIGEPTGPDEVYEDDGTSFSVTNPLTELHSVVDADSSQIEAIKMAKSGKSFVLQGPPGTGKSQTITNIIAECLYDNKKVLFVSEKLAALNVVYDKLKTVGLDEFCLQLHSHKANKKDVIMDICHTLKLSKSVLSQKADREIARKEKAQHQLDAYAFELHKPRPTIEKSLYQLYESYAAFRSDPVIDYPISQLSSKGEAYLDDTVSLLEQYVEYIPYVGYNYRKNTWCGYINQDTSYQAKSELKSTFSSAVTFFQALTSLFQEISDRYGVQPASIDDANNWCEFFSFAATSELITPSLLDRVHFGTAKSVIEKLQVQSSVILSVRSELNAVFDDGIYNINGSEYHKKLTGEFGGGFSRLFNAEYKKLITSLRSLKKDGKKVSYNEAVAMTEKLSSYQQKSSEYVETELPVRAFLGPAYKGVETDWNYIFNQIAELQVILSKDIPFGSLENYPDFNSEKKVFEDYSQKFKAALSLCDGKTLNRAAGYFDSAIFNLRSSCPISLIRLTDCLGAMDSLDNWCRFRDLLSELDRAQIVPYINATIDRNIEPKHIVGAFQKQFYYQWIDSIISGNKVLSSFSRISQDKAIQTFSDKDTEQFEINKAKICAELSSMRPSLDIVSSGSALAILLREGEKKKKQKSIRSLLCETGELVQRIKPCFLMSPLSVSTFLAHDSIHFDVVIFDEASQIFPQDAIGAIYRSKQLIVVGDSKQMPPSNFFNASLESDNNDEETGDVTDFESILDLCSTSMPQLRLCWHYRSRYEQLIAFSNKNFYDNDLVTFPSSKVDAPGIGVDYYHVNGIFDRQSHTNLKEAEFIVDLIYENIEKYPNRSLGVVAFSVAQQDLIDQLLSTRRLNTPEKEFFFKNDKKEPFFIKNLETVQGDERDTIIFSVAYGIDTNGRFLHNFGPLNRLGGERRLNVAITRAKCNVQLVSSMHYTDINLSQTSSIGAKLLREYLDYAESGNIALERTITVNTFDQCESEFELEVYEYLKSKGFSVDAQVGCSGFRIDIGLKRPDSSDYVLAIECDGASYHSSKNARDRDRLRQQILEGMGWKFYRLWSTDWFKNKQFEQERLFQAAVNALKVSPAAEVQHVECPPAVTFEETANDKEHFEFPPYKAADIRKLSKKYLPNDFKGLIKAILDVEAPLSEEFLLKRIVPYFGREKVTTGVRSDYKQKMAGYKSYGITIKNGFLYLNTENEIKFRPHGDIDRDIKYIAPEELAAGMHEIIRQNMEVDKVGLYRSIAAQCGVSHIGKVICEVLDSALKTLRGSVVIDGDRISLKS